MRPRRAFAATFGTIGNSADLQETVPVVHVHHAVLAGEVFGSPAEGISCACRVEALLRDLP